MLRLRDSNDRRRHLIVITAATREVKANGNSLREFRLRDVRVRALHLVWVDKHSKKETVLPVPRTKEQFGYDYPDNINDL